MAQSSLFRQVRQWVQEEIARRQRDVGVIGNSIDGGNVVGNSGANARVGVRKNSAGDTYRRRRLNLIEGSNITVTLVDDDTDEEVDITVAVDDPLLQSVVRALDGDGLRLEDDAGNLGVFVEDGGDVGIGTSSPAAPLHVALQSASLRVSSTSTSTYLGKIAFDDTGMKIGNTSSVRRTQLLTNDTVRLDITQNHVQVTNAGLGEAWSAPSFNTGWGNTGAPYYNVGYRLFGDMVMLRGNIVRTSGSATTAFTLPSGYQPSSTVIVSGGDRLGVEVDTSGNVIFDPLSNDTEVSLDGIMFSI